MEDHKELFYLKLLEYEKNLPKHYDKDRFVLSGLRYEAILNCLDKEKGHKTDEGVTFKHWVKNNFKKTTIGEKDIIFA
jgi:transketolase